MAKTGLNLPNNVWGILIGTAQRHAVPAELPLARTFSLDVRHLDSVRRLAGMFDPEANPSRRAGLRHLVL
jgi:hypothetical protein